jgi:hypothetical protein
MAMISVFGASELMRGSHEEIELVVTPPAPLETTGIEVRVRGIDGWKHASELAHRVTHLDRARHVIGPALLQPEPHRFPIQLALPAMMAPTHAMAPASSSLEVLVRVGVPRFWRLDHRHRFSLAVREPPPAVLDRSSISARRGALELAIAARQLVAGETLVGSCAAFAVDDSRARDITLALVPQLCLVGTHGEQRLEGPARSLAIPFPAGASGRALRFSFPVPRDLTPSFRAETHALAWSFVARLDALEAEVPVTIVDSLAASRVEPLREPPVIAGASIGPYR